MPGGLGTRSRDERLRHDFPVSRAVCDKVKAVGAEFAVRRPA